MADPVFILDDAKLRAALRGLEKAMTDMSPIMDEIGQTLQDEIRMTLGRGQTPWGEDMEPLKSRQGVPLNDTRQHIYNRITHTFDSKSVAVGMNEEVGIGMTHQFGAVIKPKKASRLVFTVGGKKVFAKQVTIPARPFLPIRNDAVDLPPQWRESLINIIKTALKNAIK